MKIKNLYFAVLIFFSFYTNAQDILPQSFGIIANGKPIDSNKIKAWFNACRNNNKRIFLAEGKYCFPVNFQYDFQDNDAIIEGVAGLSTITTYDSTSSTNFAIPLKIDLSMPHKDGVYQDDNTGNYVLIKNGISKSLTFATIKALGYVTELDTNLPDPGINGLYVVVNHPLLIEGYGGGFAHLNLKGTYNTAGQNLYYLQGTVLKRQNGVWSRHYTGAGFITRANILAKNVVFDNIQFYLFSPFDIAAKVFTTTDRFQLENCQFNNVARVISSIAYGGIDMQPNWFKASSYYSNAGQLRFVDFKINKCIFSSIHTCIVWGFPPAESVNISDNTIIDCYSILACFNLFVTNYSNPTYFTNRISQVISNNQFIRVRPLYNNFTTAIIRISGIGSVINNQFIDVTQQVCYLNGGNSKFSNNIVTKFNDQAAIVTPVILIKSTGPVINTISDNQISAATSTFVSLEGASNTIISENSFVGGTHYRLIDTFTNNINVDRVYRILDIATFKKCAINFDTGISILNYVYYNKRKKMWCKSAYFPNTYVYSKADEGSDKNQFVRISNNILESESITNIGSRTPSNFRLVNITGNEILFSVLMHSGNTKISQYICSDNIFRNLLSGPDKTNVYNYLDYNNKVMPY